MHKRAWDTCATHAQGCIHAKAERRWARPGARAATLRWHRLQLLLIPCIHPLLCMILAELMEWRYSPHLWCMSSVSRRVTGALPGARSLPVSACAWCAPKTPAEKGPITARWRQGHEAVQLRTAHAAVAMPSSSLSFRGKSHELSLPSERSASESLSRSAAVSGRCS